VFVLLFLLFLFFCSAGDGDQDLALARQVVSPEPLAQLSYSSFEDVLRNLILLFLTYKYYFFSTFID
jgi:hypothetical protein